MQGWKTVLNDDNLMGGSPNRPPTRLTFTPSLSMRVLAAAKHVTLNDNFRQFMRGRLHKQLPRTQGWPAAEVCST
jgi:hypothetical protein